VDDDVVWVSSGCKTMRNDQCRQVTGERNLWLKRIPGCTGLPGEGARDSMPILYRASFCKEGK